MTHAWVPHQYGEPLKGHFGRTFNESPQVTKWRYSKNESSEPYTVPDYNRLYTANLSPERHESRRDCVKNHTAISFLNHTKVN